MHIIQENSLSLKQNYQSIKPLTAVNQGQRIKYKFHKDGILSEKRFNGVS